LHQNAGFQAFQNGKNTAKPRNGILMKAIFDFSPLHLRELLVSWNEPAFRTSQVIQAAWTEGLAGFYEATVLPLGLRSRLDDYFAPLPPLSPSRQQHAGDGTVKVLFTFADGAEVESVAIPKEDRLTFCLSTQVGCSMGCRFCATGQLGFKRNLSAGEIIAQIRGLACHLKRKPTNLVLMGMGEPLQNLEAVRDALDLLAHPSAWNWPARRTTVSTSGWVPGIVAMTQLPVRAKLALSLNATRDDQRTKLMPVNRRFPLEKVLNALRLYSQTRKETVSIEYILIGGINDRPEDARRLGQLLKNVDAKVNLILYNPVPGLPFQRPTPQAVAAFTEALRPTRLIFTQRTSRGDSIGAACGQLAGRKIKAVA
jgi:23S rRNA (adenine2503-C2)-methyltransferase